MNVYQKYTKHRHSLVQAFFSLSVADVTNFEDAHISADLLNVYLE